MPTMSALFGQLPIFAQNPIHRRTFLSTGFLAGAGLGLADLFRYQTAFAEQKHYENFQGTAKSVIHIFLPGGMAQQESFDPKPYAPIEYRGDLNSIATNVDGLRFGEMMPHTAKIADKLTVIRSMTHGEAAHERGTHNMFTGYRPSPALNYPSIGSVISHEYGPRENLPPYVCIPNQPNEYAGSGYLSSSYSPFSLGADPAAGNGFKVRDLNLNNDVDHERFARRQQALEMVNKRFGQKQTDDSIAAMDSFYQRAYSLINSEKARDAFDLSKETDEMKKKYGENQAGSRLLMARRLVESGVRFVNVTYGGWDMHDKIVDGFKRQMPSLDQAYAALINDLDERGLLDETIVMMSSEFGRTPKINNTSGRDHWPKVFSVAMAGGGFKRGFAYGTSDSTASFPDLDPVSPEDLFATVYHCLGVVADKELMAPGNRPIEIIDGGKVLTSALA